MNRPLVLTQAMMQAAGSLRFAKTALSADQIRDLALFACTAHDALAFVREAAEAAAAQGGAIEPASLLSFLADNNLMLQPLETTNAEQSPA